MASKRETVINQLTNALPAINKYEVLAQDVANKQEKLLAVLNKRESKKSKKNAFFIATVILVIVLYFIKRQTGYIIFEYFRFNFINILFLIMHIGGYLGLNWLIYNIFKEQITPDWLLEKYSDTNTFKKHIAGIQEAQGELNAYLTTPDIQKVLAIIPSRYLFSKSIEYVCKALENESANTINEALEMYNRDQRIITQQVTYNLQSLPNPETIEAVRAAEKRVASAERRADLATFYALYVMIESDRQR